MLYLLLIYADVEPEVRGPYKTDDARRRAARAHRVRRQDRDGLFRLNIDPDAPRGQRVDVAPFSGGELDPGARS